MNRQQKFYRRHKERLSEEARVKRESPAERARITLNNIRYRSKKRGLEFDLDKEWILAGMERGCEITGLPFDFDTTKSSRSPSVDRIDSSRGYTKDNCRVILWSLNSAFGTWGEAEFRAIFAAERSTSVNLSYLYMAA